MDYIASTKCTSQCYAALVFLLWNRTLEKNLFHLCQMSLDLSSVFIFMKINVSWTCNGSKKQLWQQSQFLLETPLIYDRLKLLGTLLAAIKCRYASLHQRRPFGNRHSALKQVDLSPKWPAGSDMTRAAFHWTTVNHIKHANSTCKLYFGDIHTSCIYVYHRIRVWTGPLHVWCD